MAFRKTPLTILMWRHLKERTHRISYTFLEILSGVLVFFIMFLLKQVVVSGKAPTDGSSIETNNETINKLFYSPSNILADSLMLRVGRMLDINKSILYPENASRGLWGFQSERHMQEVLRKSNLTKPICVVVFKDPKYESASIKYSISLTKPKVDAVLRTWPSNMYESIFTQPSAENPSALVQLQWAIDKAYLEELSGLDILYDIETVPLQAGISQELKKILELLMICTIIAPLPFFLINAARLVKEKRDGLKELLKLVGVSPNILRISNLLETLVLGAVYGVLITICLKATKNPILPHSNCFIVGITIILHFLNINSLAFVTATLSQDYQHSGGVSLLVYLLMYLLDSLWYNSDTSQTVVYIVMWMLPHAPMFLFWDEVIYLEKMGEGSIFSNIIYSHTNKSVPVLLVWFCCVIQLLVILSLAWYLDLVRPGYFGVAKKWNFLFKGDFWRKKKKKVTFHVTAERNVQLLRDDRFFEKVPKHAEIAIKILNVTKVKVFHGLRQPRTVALESVSFDIYKGECAVLLGSNGAGKTTLLSIVTAAIVAVTTMLWSSKVISGMYSATSGSVYVNGLDASARIQEIRKDLGLCPQENLTFEYLTVKENIILFESLKGNSKDARSSAEHLMLKLNLNDKANLYSYQLSTGTKRCLQVACAMAGGSEVLVLDEPTSGMDSDTRHSLWDLILSMRGDTTILMTTTFIEEADALGDRIALLNDGKLRCYATPVFLKNAIGTGFSLSLKLRHKRNVQPVQELVLNALPESTVQKVERRRIAFMLPAKQHEIFPKLFDMLEEEKHALGIVSIGVGMSMDDVFLSFIEDDEFMDDPAFYTQRNDDLLQDVKLKGFQLRLQQYLFLMRRNLMCLWHKKYQFLVWQVIVPVVGLLLVTISSNNKFDESSVKNFTRDNLTVVFNNGPFRSTDVIDSVDQNHHDIQFVRSKNVSADMMKLFFDTRTFNKANTKNSFYGIEMYDKYAKIYYPDYLKSYLHNIVNVFSNLYLNLQAPYANNSINLDKHDIIYHRTSDKKKEPKKIKQLSWWTMWVVILIILSLAPYIWMSVRDRTSGIRYSLTMAGCPPAILWTAKLTVHTTVFIASVSVPLVIFVCFLDTDDTLNYMGFIVALVIVIIIFAMAFLMHLYTLSFVMSENNALTQIYIMSLVLALVIPALVDVLRKIAVDIPWTWVFEIPLEYIPYCSPIYAFIMCLDYMAVTARMNAICRVYKQLCPNINIKGFDKDACCASPTEAPFAYYAISRDFHLELLIIHFIIYFTLAIVLHRRIVHNCREHIANCRYKPPDNSFSNPNVVKEKIYVKDTWEKLKNKPSGEVHINHCDLLLVSDLHKNYVNPTCTKKCNAVRGVSFALKAGECLGILGPNSAGKTTTLLMIAGLQVATRGDVYANGCFLNSYLSKYNQLVGLTPASGGLDDFLSGYENLKLMSALQGRPVPLAERWATKCLRYMGLGSYSAVQVFAYSAGCLKRLQCASTLVLAPRVALLDEPTSHVDPRARPLIARALGNVRRAGSALVVAEHSMDWRDMESAFTRVAIMLHGELAALGSPREIQQSLASGLTVKLKIRQASVLSIKKGSKDSSEEISLDNKSERLLDLKADMHKNFPTSILGDEHLSTLYYLIKSDKDKLLYSDMFKKLEGLKAEYSDILENYTLTEATVEEVFHNLEKQLRVEKSSDI